MITTKVQRKTLGKIFFEIWMLDCVDKSGLFANIFKITLQIAILLKMCIIAILPSSDLAFTELKLFTMKRKLIHEDLSDGICSNCTMVSTSFKMKANVKMFK